MLEEQTSEPRLDKYGKIKPICHLFNSPSGCRFGKGCRYAHIPTENAGSGSKEVTASCFKPEIAAEETSDANSSPEIEQSVCKFYLRHGHCRFGSRCRFAHTRTFTSQSKGIVPDHDDDLALLNEHDEHNTTQDSTKHGHEINASGPEESKQEQELCAYFSKHGYCRFGKRCRYVHQRLPRNKKSREVSKAKENFEEEENIEHETIEDTTEKNQSKTEIKPQPKICSYFSKHGSCRFGQSCKFVHVDVTESLVYVKSGKKLEKREMKKAEGSEETKSEKPRSAKEAPVPGKHRNQAKICKFYKSGDCRRGERCRYLHPSEVIPVDDSESLADKIPTSTMPTEPHSNSDHVTKPLPKQDFQKRQPYLPVARQEINRDSVSTEELVRLKLTEIDQLKKRFPQSKMQILCEDEHKNQYRVCMSPSDPDWPYDVDVFELDVTFPSDYPAEIFKVSLSDEQNLPETLRSYVEACIREWIENKDRQLRENGVVELVFRPFLRWLDRNLENVVTEGLKKLKRELIAKAAGFEFIPANQLPGAKSPDDKESSNGSDDDSDHSSENDHDKDSDVQVMAYRKKTDESEVYQGPSKESDTDEEEYDQDINEDTPSPDENERRGTEIALRNLQLKENVATLMFTKISIVIQCGRCKNRTQVSTPPRRINSVACIKCNSPQLVTFRPTFVHQFSSVIGYLDVDGCTAFDLVLADSAFEAACMNCSKEMTLEGLPPGQLLNSWCRSCHQKLAIAAEAVKFTQLQPAQVVTGTVHQVNVQKLRKVPKDPAIQEGKPLPDNGTCKHYKKSFRWLRFPCCGKAYPCDICHDSKEDGHEMKYANRMICGFCCREQPYAAEKPCVACQSGLTRGKSAHWEGGRGCRDKISMSKGDAQKYTNVNKTVSNKAKASQDALSGKKNTKLRHS